MSTSFIVFVLVSGRLLDLLSRESNVLDGAFELTPSFFL